MQARPGPSLVVAEPEFLLAILMEALDRPALVRQSELAIEGAVVQRPGEVPLRLAILTGQGTLADEPAERTGGVARGAVGSQAAGQPLAALPLGIEHGDGAPLLVGDRRRQRLCGVHRGH